MGQVISVPAGSVVKFGGAACSQAMLNFSAKNYFMLSEDIQLTLSSQFTKLVDASAPKFFKVLAGMTASLFGFSLSGEYKQLGLQIWDSTEPLGLTFSIDLVKRMDAEQEVFLPMIELIQLPLPEDKGMPQGLVPPGPNILSAFSGSTSGQDSKTTMAKAANAGMVNIQIGSIYLSGCIVKSAVPIVSKYSSRAKSSISAASSAQAVNEFPIYAKIQVEVESSFTATRNMIRTLNSNPHGAVS